MGDERPSVRDVLRSTEGGRSMEACSQKTVLRRRSTLFLWIRAITVLGVLGATLAPRTANAGTHPQTRRGLYLGLDLSRGSAELSSSNASPSLPRESGWGGGFRLGYAPNPKFGLGIDANNWVETSEGGAVTLGTLTVAVSVFPAEGLVLRGGYGIGDA